MSQTSLPLKTLGQVLTVTVFLWSKREGRFRKADLVVDTGASVTTISRDALDLLGYDISSLNTATVTTASGVERVMSAKPEKVLLGDVELNDIEVHAHQFPNELYFSGLLGLNVLRLFDVELLFGRSLMRLTENT